MKKISLLFAWLSVFVLTLTTPESSHAQPGPPFNPPIPPPTENIFDIELFPDNGEQAPGKYVLTPVAYGTSWFLNNDGTEDRRKVVPDRYIFDFQRTGKLNMPYGYFRHDSAFVYMDHHMNELFFVKPNNIEADFHDIIIRPSSHIFTSYGLDSTPWKMKMEEINISGVTVWEWNSFDHLTPTNDLDDWHHWNSSFMTDDGKTIIMSLRHEDAVIGVAYPEGFIRWQLGGKSLGSHPMITLNNGDYPCHQHDAKMYPGNRLTIFDNGNNCRDYSRGVEYIIDFDTMTADQVLEIRGPYAVALGSYHILDNGNRLIGWGSVTGDFGGLPPQSDIALGEYSPTGDPIAYVKLKGGGTLIASYRVNKFEYSPDPASITNRAYLPIAFKGVSIGGSEN